MKLDRDRLYPWLAILRAKGMGSGRALALQKHFGSIEKALHASPEAISQVPRLTLEIGHAVREAAQGKFDREVEKELTWAEREGVRICLMDDAEYPFTLRHIPAPPALLYIKGRVKIGDVLSFAIVGSRRASDYGRRLAGQIATELAEAGLTIVSGLAWGIDAAAHMGALRCKTGRTLAVMGNGLRMVYPREHGNLAGQIVKRGALISELFYDVTPQSKNFPPRNRIISGLSLGVLIVEAPSRSGSLITANYALEQGKEIFALPGAAHRELSEGTNKLIQESSAKLVTRSEDILRDLRDKIIYYQNELEGKIPRVDIPEPRDEPVEITDVPPPPPPDAKPDEAGEPSPRETAPPPNSAASAPAAPPDRGAPAETPPEPKAFEPPPGVNLSDEERLMLKALGPEAKHIDAIGRELEWSISKTSATLGLLEFKDLVERESGMRFRLRCE